jgi:hypothetical protein
MHAVLIAAKVSGQKVRLAYDLPTPTDGLCRLKEKMWRIRSYLIMITQHSCAFSGTNGWKRA